MSKGHEFLNTQKKPLNLQLLEPSFKKIRTRYMKVRYCIHQNLVFIWIQYYILNISKIIFRYRKINQNIYKYNKISTFAFKTITFCIKSVFLSFSFSFTSLLSLTFHSMGSFYVSFMQLKKQYLLASKGVSIS